MRRAQAAAAAVGAWTWRRAAGDYEGDDAGTWGIVGEGLTGDPLRVALMQNLNCLAGEMATAAVAAQGMLVTLGGVGMVALVGHTIYSQRIPGRWLASLMLAMALLGTMGPVAGFLLQAVGGHEVDVAQVAQASAADSLCQPG